MMAEPVLCYVAASVAYFTRKPINEQRGDDWNDAPYECNAGTPYDDDGDIVRVAYLGGGLEDPDERGEANRLSVDAINAGATPWLRDVYCGSNVSIPAGVTVSEFKALVRKAGGTVFVEEKTL